MEALQRTVAIDPQSFRMSDAATILAQLNNVLSASERGLTYKQSRAPQVIELCQMGMRKLRQKGQVTENADLAVFFKARCRAACAACRAASLSYAPQIWAENFVMAGRFADSVPLLEDAHHILSNVPGEQAQQ